MRGHHQSFLDRAVLDAPCASLTALDRRPALLISVAIGARAAFVVALLFMTGCAKNERLAPEPVAVGTSPGGGSWLFGASGCTYDAPASVAELSTNDKGARFRATLVGEGSVTETCAAGANRAAPGTASGWRGSSVGPRR